MWLWAFLLRYCISFLFFFSLHRAKYFSAIGIKFWEWKGNILYFYWVIHLGFFVKGDCGRIYFLTAIFFFHFLLSVNTWSLFLSNDFLAWYRGSTDFASVHPLLFWHTIEARVAAAIPRKFPRDISIYIYLFLFCFQEKKGNERKIDSFFFLPCAILLQVTDIILPTKDDLL